MMLLTRCRRRRQRRAWQRGRGQRPGERQWWWQRWEQSASLRWQRKRTDGPGSQETRWLERLLSSEWSAARGIFGVHASSWICRERHN